MATNKEQGEALTLEEPTDLTPGQVGAWLERRLQEKEGYLQNDLVLARRQKEKALQALDVVRRELPARVNPHDLEQTGWGAIFPQGRSMKAHLNTLLAHRKKRAGELFRTFVRYKGESGESFLKKRGEILGTINPRKVPYYLLIVASPEEIPFEFQYHLSLNHAVGRIWFEKSVDYRRYAAAVVEAETKEVKVSQQATIFSVENDETTSILAKSLVKPLVHTLKTDFPDWELKVRRRSQASKDRLRRLLGGGETPGLLLVSSHGRRVSSASPELQKARQGALVCQVPDDSNEVFTAEDLASQTDDLHGLISFFFSCYGAGTPSLDNFPHKREGQGPEAALRTKPHRLSKTPFLARLPIELLKRGALAIVGHIDRGWTTSFVWSYDNEDVTAMYSLEDSLFLLLRGHRLGHAMRPLNRRYSHLASRLAQILDFERVGAQPDLERLGFYWIAVNDARNLVVVGDPAVYLLGRRIPEVTIRLDRKLLHRIEQRASRKRKSVEVWITDILRRYR